MVEALNDDQLIHEAPAIVGCRSPSALAHAGTRSELIVRHLTEIEPRLRRTCTHELDAIKPIDEIVEQLVRIGRDPEANT